MNTSERSRLRSAPLLSYTKRSKTPEFCSPKADLVELYWSFPKFLPHLNQYIGSFFESIVIITKIPALIRKGGEVFAELLRFGSCRIWALLDICIRFYCLLYSNGDIPTSFLKALLKFELVWKPQSVWIAIMLISVSLSSRLALSIRRIRIYSHIVIPFTCLNTVHR